MEQHAFFRNAVQIWSMVNPCAITAYRLGRMVIRHDEQDIGPVIFGHSGWLAELDLRDSLLMLPV